MGSVQVHDWDIAYDMTIALLFMAKASSHSKGDYHCCTGYNVTAVGLHANISCFGSNLQDSIKNLISKILSSSLARRLYS